MIGAVLAVAALAYAAGVRRAVRWRSWRTVAFMGGLLALGGALLAPDGGLAAHMAEHVALAFAAAPLLVLGAPHTLVARRSAPLLRRLRFLIWPPLAWALLAGSMLGVHLTGWFDYGAAHPWAHGLEHAALFWSAVAFWAPVCAAPPAPRTLGPIATLAYLVTAMVPMGVLGALLMNADQPLYAHHSVAAQQEAGAAMWVGGGYALVVAAVAAAWAALETEERRQRARERYEDLAA